MRKCRNWETGQDCPNFYACEQEGDFVRASGKKLRQYCYYCLGTPRVKKIGHKATWAGGTPKWCPLGRDKA